MPFVWSEVTVPTTGSTLLNVRDWAYDSGHGVIVGIGDSGLVYTSDDPTDSGSWVKQTAAAANDWRGLAYAPTLGTDGRLCAVSNGGANRVMTSDDGGVTWTARTAAEANTWQAVVWVSWLNGGSGWFVAVSSTGANRVMTSPDGITWTSQSAAAATTWTGLTASGSLLVAVNASSGTQRVMTSSDAVTWTSQTTPAGLSASTGGVPCGSNYVQWAEDAGVFAWSAIVSATSARCMITSPDGTTWTTQTIPNNTRSHAGLIPVEDVGLLHMRQSASGYVDLVNTSDDGVTWDVSDPGFYRLWGVCGITADGTAVVWGDGTQTVVLVGLNVSVDSIAPARGTKLGGTVVTIGGEGLAGVTSVTFDGTAATDVVAAADGLSVTCITPAHAVGAVDVVVVGYGTLTAAYTYVSVDKVTPNRGTTFGGTAVTITGYGFDLATGVTFDGTTATDIVYVSMTSITCVTPKHASGSVDVVVEGVGTLEDGYTYEIPVELLPPYPYYSPLEEGGSRTISKPWADWLRVVKQRIETLPGDVPAEDVIGVLDVDNIPQLPFTRITMGSPRLLGRTSSGDGDAEEIEVAPTLVLRDGVLSLAGLPSGYTIGDLLYADSANSLALLNDVSVGSYLRSGGVATAPLWSTLKLPNAATTGDLPIATSANTLTMLADVAAGSYLRSGGVGTAPLWSTVKIPNAATQGDLWYASAANTIAARGIGSSGDVLTVSGGLPVWAPTSGLGTGDLTKADDTNVTLTLGGTPVGSLFKSVSITAGWTGTLAAARLNANVVQSVVNDTNVTGSIAAQALTLGWTGTLGATRGGTGTGTQFTAGSVVFAGASGVYSQDNANLFWDDTNNHLGIGTATPNAKLAVGPTTGTMPTGTVVGMSGVAPRLSFSSDDNNMGFGGYIVSNYSSGAFLTLGTRNSAVDTDALFIKAGNVAIGTGSMPGAGSFGLIFADGTALSSMASNTAGLYANDVSGTVNMFAINEAGDVTRLTWGTPQTYNITNVTTDRAYDANATTIDELADTLGTLIDDLRNRGIVA